MSDTDLPSVVYVNSGEDLNIRYEEQRNVQIHEIPPSLFFPSEFQDSLQEEVDALKQENFVLKQRVSSFEAKTSNYIRTIEELQANSETSSSDEFASANQVTRMKVVELSRKLREKSSELVHFQTKCAKLERNLAALKLEAETTENSQVDTQPVEKPPESEIKILNYKISVLNSKLFEEKNQVLALKNDLRLATKVLQEEIGEGFENIQQIANNSKWKGRAALITDLQFKISTLKDKLKAFQDKEGNNACEIASKKMYLEKKIDRLSKENETLQREYENTLRKIDLIKHKAKNLEAELNSWKNKYQNIESVYERDHETLSAISEQNTELQTQLNEMLKRKDKLIERLQIETKESKTTIKKMRCDMENLHKSIKEKDTEIDSLKAAADRNNFDDDTSSNHLSNAQLCAERSRLLELTQLYNERLKKEREQRAELEMLYLNERQRGVKLENQLSRIHLDDSNKSSYCSLLPRAGSQGDESIQFKLEIAHEKLKALQTRLQLEKSERDTDLQQFTKILQNYQ